MSRFIKEDLIHRHETFNRLILDEKSENKGLIDNLTVKYSIKKIIISAYYFQINDIVERGHRVIINGLTKLDKLAFLSH